MTGTSAKQKKTEDAGTAGLRSRSWNRFLRGPDSSLLEDLYVPALQEAVKYDRCCSYFSSSVLAAAARGFAGLIERLESLSDKAPKPAVRLVVNEILAEEDVHAMLESGDIKALEGTLKKRFKTPKDILERQRLAMLAWLVKKGLLGLRVGVMRHGEGIVHAKFGVIIDELGDSVVFNGSGNESASGLMANYENLEVSTSWEDPERYRHYSEEFESLWRDTHPDVHTVSLPEAMRLRLIKFAPPEPPTTEPSNVIVRQKSAMVWQFIAEAPSFERGDLACDATAMVDLWPHQERVVAETARAWPGGRLLCDEVGMGKTIEAICILRRLLAGRGVSRALILLPAGIVKQWQAELREKGGIIVPRLEGPSLLVWPNERAERVTDLSEALKTNILLMSRETARTENNLPVIMAAKPWDLVVLDESHAARRKKQVEGEFNSGTLLLSLLRQLQLKGKARGFLLLSATPMQTHPWEPWDLLTILGEGGAWIAEFDDTRKYYGAVVAITKGQCDSRTARKAAELLTSDPDVPLLPGEKDPIVNPRNLAWRLASVPIRKRDEVVAWMRCASPLGRRMHRNTRETLKEYFSQGRIETPPPKRIIEDNMFDYLEAAERRLYNSIKGYIDKRYSELEAEKPGKGFVMTVYRRRASSSPQALERSLKRRLSGLQRVIEREAYDYEVGDDEKLSSRDLDDAGISEERISAVFPTDPRIAKVEADEVQSLLYDLRALHGIDSKRDQFYGVLRRVVDDGRGVLIFSEYLDTMEYIRDNLQDLFGHSLGCYSGEGGQLWDGTEWKKVTKDVITDKLQKGEIKALVCTDAASEGLNLQAAGAVINYDLPWNPSKVEQRIGRIDRIGQKLTTIKIVNFFLKDSIDERVYRILRERCGLFEHFVGAMQPVLSRARMMLLGQEVFDVDALEGQASEAEKDFLATETYFNSRAVFKMQKPPPLNKQQLEKALSYLREDIGFRITKDKTGKIFRIRTTDSAGFRCALDTSALESNTEVLPLNPAGDISDWVVERLSRPGENLPLVVGSYKEAGFRSSVLQWIEGRSVQKIENFDDLEKKLDSWSGDYPDPNIWLKAQAKASREARKNVKKMIARAHEIEEKARKRQIEAASLRLLKELGRFLVCVDEEVGDLNRVLFRQRKRDIATAHRLEKCLDKLGGYPEWPEALLEELREFLDRLTPNDRNARLLGSQLDAALDDPRWMAVEEK
jgi:superfamily II DNA or RNA helicase